MSFLDPFILPSKKVSFLTKIKRYFYKSKLQESAGTITYFMDPDKKTPLFLQFFVSENGKSGEWWFPKGVVEPTDNNYEQRAVQETREEVGLEVDIITKLSSNSYIFYWDNGKTKFTKTVHYFLAKSASKDVELAKYSTEQSEKDQFKEFTWSSIQEAINKTNHVREKEILLEAFTFVTEHSQ